MADLDDNVIKHLEFIQAIIARLATDSFLMKGWGLTVSGAFFGFSVKDLNWRIAAVGLLPVVAFWGLDAYFLSRERLFRRLYRAVRQGDSQVEPFSMDYTVFRHEVSWVRCAWSPTLWIFYGSILVVGIAVIIAGALHSGS